MSLKVPVRAEYGDFEKKKPKRNCPNKEKLEMLISEHFRKYSQEIIDLVVEGKDYTTTTLIEKVSEVKCVNTVDGLFQKYINRLLQEG